MLKKTMTVFKFSHSFLDMNDDAVYCKFAVCLLSTLLVNVVLFFLLIFMYFSSNMTNKI